MKSHEDFFLLNLYAHIIVVANKCIEHTPSQSALNIEGSKQIISKWVKFDLPTPEPLASSSHEIEVSVLETSPEGLLTPAEASPSDVEMSSDIEDGMESETEMETDLETSPRQAGNGTINNYAVDMLSLGFLWCHRCHKRR